MSLLFESIKISGRHALNLHYHSSRMNRARNILFHEPVPLDLEKLLQIPGKLDERIYKCRIFYSREIEKIEFAPYIFRQIKTFKPVHAGKLEYAFKFTDRTAIDKLLLQKGDFDDILIIKNGRVTDTSFANVVFFDGHRWLTPSGPLLAGTQRASLLEEGLIFEEEILEKEIPLFQKIKIINAFNNLQDSI